jgi:hypothetical protein
MTGLGFGSSGTLKKKSSIHGHHDVVNAHRYCGYARHFYGYAHRYRFF